MYMQDLRQQLQVENSIAEGATSLLDQGLTAGDDDDGQEELRQQVRAELEAARNRIRVLEEQLERAATIFASPEAGQVEELADGGALIAQSLADSDSSRS